MLTHSQIDDDFEERWVQLAAATKNVLRFLAKQREAATDAVHVETSVAVIPPEGGQATELE